ncbi:MAG TPA: SAM-dependent methyltransferase, partial [Pyrinomonadaceae bacterium]|nr:SAM-dependent methyltransferase [Pyrinomonadaceae bacterium]
MQIAHKHNAALEQRRRLSQSILWKLQRNYFECEGIEAWSTGTVPHHITSSPFIADSYARIVSGYLRDCLFTQALDRNEPVYIVELGSGSGRFSYLFLKAFLDRYRNSVLKDTPIKYVMTDFAEQNLEYCRQHPWFQSFIKDGVLDFARFDVERDRNLKLIDSGETITAKNLRNPLVVIANYVFDGVPQDAFSISDGQLFETLVTLSKPEQEQDLEEHETHSQLKLSYDSNPVKGNYYKDATWNRILLDYQRRLSDAPFLFPTAALQCIRNLHHLSRGRMLLLSGDRGYSSDEALLEGKGVPTLAVHGSFSMMVDYQIIGEYCRHLGGDALHPGRQVESLNISAFMFGDSHSGFVEMRQAYAEAIEKFGPDDFFTLKEGIAQIYDALSLGQILAFLRLSCWDHKRFWECVPIIKQHLPDLSDIQKQQLHETIIKVWNSYLPIGEENDLAFELGTLLLEMEFHADALEFLHRSADLSGIAPGTAYNIAVCHYGLGQINRALEYLDHAIGLDPKFAEAIELRSELEFACSGAQHESNL